MIGTIPPHPGAVAILKDVHWGSDNSPYVLIVALHPRSVRLRTISPTKIGLIQPGIKPYSYLILRRRNVNPIDQVVVIPDCLLPEDILPVIYQYRTLFGLEHYQPIYTPEQVILHINHYLHNERQKWNSFENRQNLQSEPDSVVPSHC